MPGLGQVAVLTGYAAVATTTSANGSAVDLSSYVNTSNFDMAAVLYSVKVTGTQGNLAVKIQESDTTTTGDFSDISGATFTALTTATASDGTVQKIDFVTNKRYIRFVTTASGTSPNYTVAGSVLIYKKLA